MSNTEVVIISPRATQQWGTIITVQMEWVLILLRPRSRTRYLSTHFVTDDEVKKTCKVTFTLYVQKQTQAISPLLILHSVGLNVVACHYYLR